MDEFVIETYKQGGQQRVAPQMKTKWGEMCSLEMVEDFGVEVLRMTLFSRTRACQVIPSLLL